MHGLMQSLGRFCAVACLTAIMLPSLALAQERPSVELVSVDREAGVARILVHTGGRVRDLNRMARRHATVPGLHVDMDMLARWNPERIIYVCFDNLRGERPLMARTPALAETCIGYRSARWLVAGETYLVPLQPEDAPEVPASSASVTVVRPDLADRVRIAELESERDVLATSVEDAHADLLAADETESRLAKRVEALEDEAGGGLAINLMLVVCIFLLIALIAYLFYRFRNTLRRIMKSVREERAAWSRYAASLRRSKATIESNVGMLTRGITKSSNELTRSLAQQGRLRKRIQTYFVQRQELRKLLLAATHLIQSFQRERQEDDDRRKRIPNLLKTVDDGRRQWVIAEAARAKIKMIEKWRKEVDAVDYPEMVYEVYDRMIADYREIELQANEPIDAAIEARSTLRDDFYALTGIKTDSVEPDVRLNKSIEAAERNAELLNAQSEALTDLIRLHTSQLGEFHGRDEAIKSREAEVAEAEAELVRRMKEFEARVELWERAHEQKSDVAAWTGGLAKLEESGRVSEVEARLAALEGRTNGLERRALSAERDLSQNNDFLEKVQKEFRAAKELLEGIKKGPNFVEARLAQYVEYAAQLEDRLGIERKSIWAGLPELAYGSIPPKNKA